MSTNILISDYIYPLDQFGKIGKVHSVFAHSFNVVVAEQLINIANYQEYLSCFGCYLPEELFSQIQPYAQQGAVVKFAEASLLFYSGEGVKKLDLTDHQLVSLQVSPPIPVVTATLLTVKELLEAEQLTDLIGLPQDETFQGFQQQLLQPASADWWAVTSWFVGRGPGLTPSGDDLLVAYLFVLTLFGHEAAAPLAAALMQQRFKTTAISRGYLEAASDGYVNSLIYHFYQLVAVNADKQQLKEAIKAIMAMGHTSGKDLSYGVYLGVMAILNLK